MYERIFGSYPQVKVLNYVLVNPEKSYTKKEIAYGAKISRVTLDSFIANLEDLQIFIKDNSSYKINLESKIVKLLIKSQIKLASYVMEQELKNPQDVKGQVLTEEEFEKFMNNFDFEIDMDKELDRLEADEEIAVKTKADEDLSDMKINASDINETNFVVNAFYPQYKDKKMINYG